MVYRKGLNSSVTVRVGRNTVLRSTMTQTSAGKGKVTTYIDAGIGHNLVAAVLLTAAAEILSPALRVKALSMIQVLTVDTKESPETDLPF